MSAPDLLEEVLDTENRELRLLAANGMLPLVPEELVKLQIQLASQGDEELAGFAIESLSQTDPTVLARFVKESAEVDGLEYLARSSTHPVVLEAIIRRRDSPRALLEELASRLGPALQEVLVLRQDAISEHPAILEALESNPDLSNHVRRRLLEYRELMAPGSTSEKAGSEPDSDAVEGEDAEDLEPVVGERIEEEEEGSAGAPKGEDGWWEELGDPVEGQEIDDEEALARAEKVLEQEDEDEVVGKDRGLSEAEIRSLPIPDRLKLTRGASKGLRGILIKDANPLVAMSVLDNNTLSEQEVESVARNRSVIDDVLKAIGRNRQWMRKYPIVQALATNPKTPVHVSIKLIPQLTPRDLKGLMKDRNLPEAVRSQARRLHQARTG